MTSWERRVAVSGGVKTKNKTCVSLAVGSADASRSGHTRTHPHLAKVLTHGFSSVFLLLFSLSLGSLLPFLTFSLGAAAAFCSSPWLAEAPITLVGVAQEHFPLLAAAARALSFNFCVHCTIWECAFIACCFLSSKFTPPPCGLYICIFAE